MLALVNLLPAAWQPKAKAIAAALGVVLAAVVYAVPNLPSWAALAVAILTALGVYQTPAPGYDAPDPGV